MPKQHLPLLYLFSWERDNGKSAFYRALGLLFSRGFVEGVRALNEKFNKLLAGAVLVYLDEEKVSRESAQKVKLFIDSDDMTMRLMRPPALSRTSRPAPQAAVRLIHSLTAPAELPGTSWL